MCFLSAFPPIWLKTQLVAKQRSVCFGHPLALGAHPLGSWALLVLIRGFATTHTKILFSPSAGVCKPGLSKAPCCFCNWPIVRVINISVPHTIILLKAPLASPAAVCCLCTISWATLSYFRWGLLIHLRRDYQTLPLTQGSSGDKLMTRPNKPGLVKQNTLPLGGISKEPQGKGRCVSAVFCKYQSPERMWMYHIFPLFPMSPSKTKPIRLAMIQDYLLHCSALHEIGSSTRRYHCDYLFWSP